MSFYNFKFLAAALAAVSSICSHSSCAQTPKTKPNIILIISDDHRWDGLGIAGNSNIKTPNLDRMAREGQWFREATIQVPTCTASRATILTGIPPSEHGFYSNNFQRKDVLQPDAFSRNVLLPEEMQKAGYHTALAGKWHLQAEPWLVGFKTIKRWMLAGAGPYRNPRLAEGKSRDQKQVQGFTQTLFADDAINVLNKKASGETTQPLFLWLAFTAPHSHFGPNPKPFDGMYEGKTAKQLAPSTYYDDPSKREDSDEKWQSYYESISALDAEVGRVLDKVRNSALSTNTLVVFLGDNGYMMGRRDMWGKYVPYEDSLRVPMIAWGPDHIVGTEGTTVTASANSIDLPPTFVKLAGGTAPAEWAGRDLTPVLKDGKEHDITWAVSQYPDHRSPQKNVKAYRVIRTPEYKLIHFHPESGQSPELYNLQKDPAENVNLYGKPEVAEIQQKLEKQLADFRQENGDTEWDMTGPVASFRQMAKGAAADADESAEEAEEDEKPAAKKKPRAERRKQRKEKK